MLELLESRYNMLNPIITKWLQIQTILYSKSFAHFGPVASQDPNKAITHKKIYDQGKPQSRPAGAMAEPEAKQLDRLAQRMQVIEAGSPGLGAF